MQRHGRDRRRDDLFRAALTQAGPSGRTAASRGGCRACASPGDVIHVSKILDLSQDELRSSHTPWKTPSRLPHQIKPGSFRCDVLIVGAGITGALVAERLTREGRDVVIVDREDPTQGSTFASTAMLLWDIDRTLGQLVDLYGFERAVRAYQASLAAARGLVELVSHCGVACGLRRRNALYLPADENRDRCSSPRSALRSRAGLPTAFLAHSALQERFGILRSGAILSPDARRCAIRLALAPACSMWRSPRRAIAQGRGVGLRQPRVKGDASALRTASRRRRTTWFSPPVTSCRLSSRRACSTRPRAGRLR